MKTDGFTPFWEDAAFIRQTHFGLEDAYEKSNGNGGFVEAGWRDRRRARRQTDALHNLPRVFRWMNRREDAQFASTLTGPTHLAKKCVSSVRTRGNFCGGGARLASVRARQWAVRPPPQAPQVEEPVHPPVRSRLTARRRRDTWRQEPAALLGLGAIASGNLQEGSGREASFPFIRAAEVTVEPTIPRFAFSRLPQ